MMHIIVATVHDPNTVHSRLRNLHEQLEMLDRLCWSETLSQYPVMDIWKDLSHQDRFMLMNIHLYYLKSIWESYDSNSKNFDGRYKEILTGFRIFVRHNMNTIRERAKQFVRIYEEIKCLHDELNIHTTPSLERSSSYVEQEKYFREFGHYRRFLSVLNGFYLNCSAENVLLHQSVVTTENWEKLLQSLVIPNCTLDLLHSFALMGRERCDKDVELKLSQVTVKHSLMYKQQRY